MKKVLAGADARHDFLVFQGVFVCILQALAASTLPALEYLWVRGQAEQHIPRCAACSRASHLRGQARAVPATGVQRPGRQVERGAVRALGRGDAACHPGAPRLQSTPRTAGRAARPLTRACAGRHRAGVAVAGLAGAARRRGRGVRGGARRRQRRRVQHPGHPVRAAARPVALHTRPAQGQQLTGAAAGAPGRCSLAQAAYGGCGACPCAASSTCTQARAHAPGPRQQGGPRPSRTGRGRRARRQSWRPRTARAAQRCRWTCAARSRATAWWWPLRYAPPAPAPQRRSCTAVCASPSARARAVRARSPQRPWRRRWPSACCCWRGGRRRRPCAGRRWPRRGCARPSAWSCWARAWRPACRLPACGRAARRPEPPLPLSPRAAQVEGAPRRAQADLLALERSRVAELQALAAQLRAALAKAGYTEAAGAGAGCARGAAHAWQGLARALSPHAARAARRPAEEGKQVAGWAGPAAGAPDPLNLLGLAPAAGDLDKAGALSAHGPESPLLRIAVPGLSEQPPVASPDSPGDEKKKARRISAAADASLLGRLEGRSGDARRAPPRRSGRRSGTWSWRSTRQARTPPTPRRTPRTRLSEALRAG